MDIFGKNDAANKKAEH
jgi:hypothetical protein